MYNRGGAVGVREIEREQEEVADVEQQERKKIF
jgi:hypothetical protein